MTGPCGWTVAKCDCSGDDWASYSAETRAQATTLATHFIWAATGRRYGLCEQVVMPCNPPPVFPLYRTYPVRVLNGFDNGDDPWGLFPGGAALVAGQWRNNACRTGCRCAAACEVGLDGPVDSIIEVRVDGDVVDQSTYQVHDRRLLVRIGGDCWPSCAVYGSEIPGFEVIYLRGDPIPPAVQTASDILACEYAKACTGKDCALPSRLQSLSRQGVNLTVAAVDLEKGRLRTNIIRVDAILDADNPHGLTQAPTVLSPDLLPARTITWAGGS